MHIACKDGMEPCQERKIEKNGLARYYGTSTFQLSDRKTEWISEKPPVKLHHCPRQRVWGARAPEELASARTEVMTRNDLLVFPIEAT
jgi:hypothetical protein